ncbi:HK97-gp10 family putative phage morphogenesis protein [Paenibacillus paeoniae]|uniref:HK97 gp10 family phage protein n=1 Tax=Paenibacillus paeoniae TaxID=2292705 RepID=A0A371P1A9_9BACL|nr:HK97-gp10 family putative phage morphogenesis protein [Paenibacillus paeoniae]REK69340.1 HK97 gp10 family phage protein [Paenibacillus paeoniae]
MARSMQGLDKLMRKLDQLGGNTGNALKVGIAQATKEVQRKAKLLAPSNDGYLRTSIHADVEVKGELIIGRVFTNLEYAPYVEFGTGPVGESSDKGDMPAEVLNQLAYKQNGWWIHESQIDSDVAEKYHFYKIETNQGIFYYTEGQPAQPFLHPALVESEKRIGTIVRAALRKEIEKLGGKS